MRQNSCGQTDRNFKTSSYNNSPVSLNFATAFCGLWAILFHGLPAGVRGFSCPETEWGRKSLLSSGFRKINNQVPTALLTIYPLGINRIRATHQSGEDFPYRGLFVGVWPVIYMYVLSLVCYCGLPVTMCDTSSHVGFALRNYAD